MAGQSMSGGKAEGIHGAPGWDAEWQEGGLLVPDCQTGIVSTVAPSPSLVSPLLGVTLEHGTHTRT